MLSLMEHDALKRWSAWDVLAPTLYSVRSRGMITRLLLPTNQNKSAPQNKQTHSCPFTMCPYICARAHNMQSTLASDHIFLIWPHTCFFHNPHSCDGVHKASINNRPNDQQATGRCLSLMITGLGFILALRMLKHTSFSPHTCRICFVLLVDKFIH